MNAEHVNVIAKQELRQMGISHVRLHVIRDRNSNESFDMRNNILISNDYCRLHSIRDCRLWTADCRYSRTERYIG